MQKFGNIVVILITTYFIASMGAWYFKISWGRHPHLLDYVSAITNTGLSMTPVLVSSALAAFFLFLSLKMRKVGAVLFFYATPFYLAVGFLLFSFWTVYPDFMFEMDAPLRIIKIQKMQIEKNLLYATGISLLIPVFWFKFLNTDTPFKNDSTKYGRAKWATAQDIKKAALMLGGEEGLVLGKWSDGRLIRANLPYSMLVLAPPGTGKTASLVVANLLKLNNSVVVYDKKGELHKLTEVKREQMGSNVLVFEPKSSESSVFNPLSSEFLSESIPEVHEYITNIANALIPDNEKNTFFTTAAQEVFTFFALFVVWQNKIKKKEGIPTTELSFSSIRDELARDPDVKRFINKNVISRKTKPTELVDTKETYLPPRSLKELATIVLHHAESKEQWAGILGVLGNHLNFFGLEGVKNATSGKSEITGETLRKKNTTLYIKIKENDAKTLAPLVTLIFTILGRELTSEMPSKGEQRVTFLLDEFASIAPSEELVRKPEITRGYNMQMVFIAQDYGQIEKIYDRETISMLETNCEYKVILRQNNYQTAKRVSELIGKKTEIRQSISLDKKQLVAKQQSESLQEEGVNLVEPQEILEIPKGECIILAGGLATKPIKAKLPFLIKESTYIKMITPTSSLSSCKITKKEKKS